MIFIITTIIFIFFLYVMFKIRYDSSARTFLLRSISSLQGVPSIVLRSNPKLCKAVLESSDTKGKGIEFHLALAGWLPIYNSESVDGERWKKLLTIFRKIVPCLDYSDRLPKLVKKHVAKLSQEFDEIDSIAIQTLTMRVFFELVFKKEIKDKEEEELFIKATNEWKKHVALKGNSDLVIKEKMINIFIEYLNESEYNPEKIKQDHKADNYEMVSMFMQPFIISPVINFADIYAELFILLEENPIYKEKILSAIQENVKDDSETDILMASIYETIRLKHPFPMLERDLLRDVTYNGQTIKKGTHVYVELDSFEQNKRFCPENWLSNEYYKENQWILFASGPRMCAGRLIAQKMFQHMLRELIISKNGDFDKFKTWKNHSISGRRNDNSFSFEEAKFQVKTFGSLFYRLIKKRLFI